MNSANRKAPGARGIAQPFNRRPGHAPQVKSMVAQPKSAVAAQSIKRPSAPQVYKPQPREQVAQAKTAAPAKAGISAQTIQRLVGPTAFRPQTMPKAVQLKPANVALIRKLPVAPPIYRPQPLPRVLQTKTSSAQRTQPGQALRQPVAPPPYRPEPKKLIQPKVFSVVRKPPGTPAAHCLAQQRIVRPETISVAQRSAVSKAPPVYRPQPRRLNALLRATAEMKNSPRRTQTKESYAPFALSRSSVQRARAKKALARDETQPAAAPEGEGAQSKIQNKMIDVCKLLLGADQISAQLQTWFKAVAINGLCGGWAAVHRSDPDAVTRIWKALRDWDPKDGLKGLKGVDAAEIVAVLSHAYNTMNELEPTANYGVVPEAIESRGGKIGSSKLSKVKSFSIMVGEQGGGGKKVLDSILAEPKVKKTGNTCIIHLETEQHHMSIRTRSIKSETRIVEIVESEKSGITQLPSKSEAYRILDGGIYLGNMKDFEVDVSIFLLN